MAAILPSINIDSDAQLARYFLPYQLKWIADDATMRLAEKSVRIGWTYCDAFKNTRKRLHLPNRDYLFATKDQQSAIEYLDTCKKFAELFNFTRSIISSGIETMKVEAKDAAGKSFLEEVKFGVIKFDNGSRIIAFSANPYAMAVFGGDVGLDEFAKHPNAEKLWETAQGRITWGYDLGVWSAHDGTDTLFYQFSREAHAGKGSWNHYKVTMEDALDMGLLEKINAITGKAVTKEEFIQSCKDRARLPEIYEQAYNCNPSGSTNAIVPWAQIEQCRLDHDIERVHLESKQIAEIFGTYDRNTKHGRERAIDSFMRQSFPRTFMEPAHRRLGFDVAASGQGDLAAIYIDAKDGGRSKLDALFTCRTDDWHFLKHALWSIMGGVGGIRGAGDETGLGKQICWETKQEFPNRFHGVNFSTHKHAMGMRLMNQLAEASKCFPKGHDDIAQDYFSMRKTYSGSRWVFSESRNNLNPASHCDIAWAGALASEADTLANVECEAILISSDDYF